jgi:adenine phosphoribosyltransferase
MKPKSALAVTDLGALIHDVPDFPKPGIMFKDITPLLGDPAGLALAVECLAQPFRRLNVDKVVGAESRGFIFGTAVAQSLSAGFVPVRKPDKLPRATLERSYALEYGTNKLYVHRDAINEGEIILLVDDLLATGGTVAACGELVEELGGQVVGAAFLIELCALGGRTRIAKYPVHAVLRYED